jgi:hypothetical protein
MEKFDEFVKVTFPYGYCELKPIPKKCSLSNSLIFIVKTFPLVKEQDKRGLNDFVPVKLKHGMVQTFH